MGRLFFSWGARTRYSLQVRSAKADACFPLLSLAHALLNKLLGRQNVRTLLGLIELSVKSIGASDQIIMRTCFHYLPLM
jgi:hypothetical protein